VGPGQHRPVRHQVQLRSPRPVLVTYDKQLVKDAPRVDPDQHLSEAEERQLWQHYGLDYDTVDRSVATGEDATSRTKVGRETSGPTTDDALTRSDDELRVGTTQRERGRVRLRKYVTTEQVEQAVPVRWERVRVAEELRQERIEVDDEGTRGGRRERRRRG